MRELRRKKKVMRCLALLALVLVAAGCAHEDRRQTPAVVAHPSITGGGLAERRALRAILSAMAPTHIRAVQVSARTLTVDSGESVRGEWEGGLLAAVYNTQHPFAHLVMGDGISGPGVIPDAPRFDVEKIRAVVRRGDATIIELRREGLGLAVVVRSDNVARFLKDHGLALVKAIGTKPLRAIYVGIENNHGAVVYTFGRLPSEGIFYTRPELDQCGPIQHSSPVTAKAPPPCAA